MNHLHLPPPLQDVASLREVPPCRDYDSESLTFYSPALFSEEARPFQRYLWISTSIVVGLILTVASLYSLYLFRL